MTKALYKNALRSKRLIREAFFELLNEKDISEIKIKEIIERADISKGTFYAHYQGVYGIYKEIEDENVSNIIEYLNDVVDLDFLPFISKIFDYVEMNKDAFVKLFSSSISSRFQEKLQAVVVSYLLSNKELLAQFENEIVARQFLNFIAVGTANLMRDYFLSTNTQSTDEIKKNLNLCIMASLNAIKHKS